MYVLVNRNILRCNGTLKQVEFDVNWEFWFKIYNLESRLHYSLLKKIERGRGASFHGAQNMLIGVYGCKPYAKRKRKRHLYKRCTSPSRNLERRSAQHNIHYLIWYCLLEIASLVRSVGYRSKQKLEDMW